MFKAVLFLLTIMALADAAAALPLNKVHQSAAGRSVMKNDSSKIEIRQFNAAAIKKYAGDPVFNYGEKKTSLTWWDRFWEWVWDTWNSFWAWVAGLLGKLFRNVNMGRQTVSVIRFIVILLGSSLVVYVIFKLIGIDLLKFLRKNQTITEIPYSESVENIHQINFDEAIENALSVKDYRLAVRLLYLRSLKKLSDADLIIWRMEKTNNAYFNELKDEAHRRRFSAITRQFEYVWYGNFPVDGRSFGSINTFFQEFNQGLP